MRFTLCTHSSSASMATSDAMRQSKRNYGTALIAGDKCSQKASTPTSSRFFDAIFRRLSPRLRRSNIVTDECQQTDKGQMTLDAASAIDESPSVSAANIMPVTDSPPCDPLPHCTLARVADAATVDQAMKSIIALGTGQALSTAMLKLKASKHRASVNFVVPYVRNRLLITLHPSHVFRLFSLVKTCVNWLRPHLYSMDVERARAAIPKKNL